MKVRNLAGQIFTRLTVLERAQASGNDRRVMWRCRCECGAEIIANSNRLLVGQLKSCGCLRLAAARTLGLSNTTHGHAAPRTRTYGSWLAMKSRCYKASDVAYARYGGRGISVCKAWRESFESFLHDMGERPVGRTLDRIDNRFGYFYANCRWATPHEQIVNQRHSGAAR